MSEKTESTQTQMVHHPFPEDQRSVTPMELIQSAMNQNADITKLEKLLDLQLRWEANEAKKAFAVAMATFKANPPQILKDHHVDYTTKTGQRVQYDHATLGQVCDKITEHLSKNGISLRWKVDQSQQGLIKVTCVLTHVMGHSEETTLSAGPDDSGGKNSIQSIASAVKYLQRYTVLAATGLEAGNGDNDGQGVPQWDKLQEFLDSMSTAPNITILETTFKAGYKEASSLKNTPAMKSLISAKDKRKAELAKGVA